ncbi:hypothetical protein [Streptobacillus moniliformis]|uniref:hypothetical protein n=1 Tax=Streptobacillus moniliformis TaxID=34105 RepID=UPI0007E409F1|nr:hypothetical protein [Streptobacillus moniliformis]
MIFYNKNIMKRMFFLLLLSSLSYSKEIKSKVNGEITFGVDAAFGADGLESIVRLFPPMIDLYKPIKYSDYEKDENIENLELDDSATDVYIPKYNKTMRDLELAVKYLSKNAEFRKRLGVKLKEEYIGLGLKIDIVGKKIPHIQFLSNNDIDKLKVSLTSDNKYVNGEINYYIKGESSEKIDIDKIDEEKKLKNRVVDYSFTVNPRPDDKWSISLDFSGMNRNLNIGPTIRYRNGGTYANISILFNNIISSYDLTDEIDKIKHSAPGYDKIEYFKKWTLKNETLEKEIDKNKYDEKHADLMKAEVSGTKGTARILGNYSGSLYGDSPFRYFTKTLFDEIHSNSKFSSLSSILKTFEKEEKVTKSSFISLSTLTLSSELSNEKNINEAASKIATKIYRRLGIGLDRKYSSVGLWKQIPKDFEYLLAGYYANFDYSNIKSEKLDADYLYNNGVKKPIIKNAMMPASIVNTKNEKYELKERLHYFSSDVDKYLKDEIFREYEIEKFKNLINTSTTGLIFDGFLGIFSNDTKINQVLEILPKIQEVVKNPYEVKGLDMLRGLYLHQSEKERNIVKYEEIIKKSFQGIDLKNNNARFSNKIRINIGHVGKNYKLGTDILLNDNIHVDADKYGYVKRSKKIGFEAIYKKSLLELYNKIELSLDKNYLFRKDNKVKYVYDTTSLNTDTYLGLDIPVNDRFNLGLGIRHIGNYGFINPKGSTDENGNEIKHKIAKRDDNNNPIGKDGEAITTSQSTEKELVDKEYERLKKEYDEKNTQPNKKLFNKLKRDIHQSDFIETIESDAISSKYEMYNIVSPRVTMRYRAYRNLIISSHLEVPISIRNSLPAGIRGVYTGEIKYLIDDSFADIVLRKQLPIKFKTTGNIEAGLLLGSKIERYLSYKAMVDIGFLRGDIKGNNKNFDISVSFNPLIIDFPVKPRILLAKEGKETGVKFGLEYSEDSNFSSILGFKKVIKSNKDIFKDELKPDVIRILKTRKEKEYEKVKDKIEALEFNGKITHELTPFISIKKDEGKFKIAVKADSIKTSGHSYSEIINIGEFKERKPTTYFAWNYHKYKSYLIFFSINTEYNYFIDIKSDKITDIDKRNKNLDNEVYNFEIDTEYTQDKGINFNLDLSVMYNETKLSEITEKIKKTETKSRVISIKTKKQILDENKIKEYMDKKEHKEVNINKDNILNSLKEHANSEKSEYNDIYNSETTFLLKQKIDEEKLKNILDIPSRIKEEKSIKETVFLRTKKIISNLDMYLGYNIKPTDKIKVAFGMKYNLGINYETLNKVILDDELLFGSRTILFKNTITPEVKMKYNLIHNLNTNLGLDLPINFENIEFKGVKFNIKAGFEYNW